MVQDRDPTRAERELLDAVERGGRSPAGRTAVHLHLSQLLPSNRPPGYLMIAARLFSPLESSHAVQVFSLSSGDIFILGKDMPEAEVDRLVHRVRSLFEADPLTFQDFEDDDDPFVTWYAYEVDYDELLGIVRSLLEVAELLRQQKLAADRPPAPLTPADLEQLHEKLSQLNLQPVLRRQPCIQINERRQASILFEEFTVAVSEVCRAIAPGLDLFSDRWLFQDLSRTLDTRLLHALPAVSLLNSVPAASINVNLESTRSAAFRNLLTRVSGQQRLLAEVQVIDIFTNLSLYQDVRDELRSHGHAVIIDGLSPAVPGAMNLPLLDPDYVKILWAADLAAPRHPRKGESLADVIADLGAERVILSRCESEIAMSWGLEQGINAFQGRFVDAVLATVTLQQCPSAAGAGCTLRACMNRRAAVGGRQRMECPDPPWLDKVQSFAAPSRRRPASSHE